uniref:Uncharacterized protein n=1 Tax=Triticum urartu TaxID=4572 RepID=A0A8R7PGF2_TRIUA
MYHAKSLCISAPELLLSLQKLHEYLSQAQPRAAAAEAAPEVLRPAARTYRSRTRGTPRSPWRVPGQLPPCAAASLPPASSGRRAGPSSPWISLARCWVWGLFRAEVLRWVWIGGAKRWESRVGGARGSTWRLWRLP